MSEEELEEEAVERIRSQLENGEKEKEKIKQRILLLSKQNEEIEKAYEKERGKNEEMEKANLDLLMMGEEEEEEEREENNLLIFENDCAYDDEDMDINVTEEEIDKYIKEHPESMNDNALFFNNIEKNNDKLEKITNKSLPHEPLATPQQFNGYKSFPPTSPTKFALSTKPIISPMSNKPNNNVNLPISAVKKSLLQPLSKDDVEKAALVTIKKESLEATSREKILVSKGKAKLDPIDMKIKSRK